MKKPDLTIIIVSYNTRELLENCLESIALYRGEVSVEVIVSDNGSNDKSAFLVKKRFPWVRLLTGENEGFSKGNNRARPYVKSDLVLFLNPDTVIYKNVLKKTVSYIKNNPSIGALGCRVFLPDGSDDRDARRSFPTPWVSATHLVIPLDRMFPKSKIFARYWYTYIPASKMHEVDSIQGAFFLTRKDILDKVGWFDEGYYFDGEDIDLCFQIKRLGYKIVYYPKVSITHVKGASKGKVEEWRHKVDKSQRIKVRLAGIASMERFYRKNLWNRYPLLFNYFVILGINLLKVVRFVKVKFT